jgi:hypothetical protein
MHLRLSCMVNEQKSRTAHEKHGTVDLYEGLITEISKQVGRGDTGHRRSIFTMRHDIQHFMKAKSANREHIVAKSANREHIVTIVSADSKWCKKLQCHHYHLISHPQNQHLVSHQRKQHKQYQLRQQPSVQVDRLSATTSSLHHVTRNVQATINSKYSIPKGRQYEFLILRVNRMNWCT